MKFISHAEDALGYPSRAFEVFYQQGIECFRWGLPKHLVDQAFAKVCRSWKQESGPVFMWQIRAFVYGLKGYGAAGQIAKMGEGYRWPTPPDSSWKIVICVYPDGFCDIDMLHPISRRFWSEDNGFLDLPSYDRNLIEKSWFESMGFEILIMQPELKVMESNLPKNPLHLV